MSSLNIIEGMNLTTSSPNVADALFGESDDIGIYAGLQTFTA
jgi:hypothetical protein